MRHEWAGAAAVARAIEAAFIRRHGRSPPRTRSAQEESPQAWAGNPVMWGAVAWVALSLFVHVTVVPTATFSGFGENAVVVRLNAPLTIDVFAVALVGVGVGDIVEVELIYAAAGGQQQSSEQHQTESKRHAWGASCRNHEQTHGHRSGRDYGLPRKRTMKTFRDFKSLSSHVNERRDETAG